MSEIDQLSSGLLTEEEQIKQSYDRRSDTILLSTKITSNQQKELLDRLEKQYQQNKFDSLYSGLLTEEEQIKQSYDRRKTLIIESELSTNEQKSELINRINQQYQEQLIALQQSQYDSLYSGLLTEEEEIRLSYDRRIEQIISSTIATEEQKADIVLRINKQLNDKLIALDSQKLQNSKSIFDSMLVITKDFAGQQTGIYKVLFVVSKAFGIADSTVQFLNATAKAANLPWPANLAAIATTMSLAAKNNIRY